MDSERTEAVVLRLQLVTESSLIVTWYSREFGKLRTVAKGARRPHSPFCGKLDLFYLDEILFLRSRRSDLHLLQDCFLLRCPSGGRGSLAGLAAASYACELVELATVAEDANVRVFDLLNVVLESLGDRPSEVLLIWFELQLLSELGWRPQWRDEDGVRKVLQSLSGASLEAALRVRLTVTQVEDTRTMLWQTVDRELGREPRSRKLLRQQ